MSVLRNGQGHCHAFPARRGRIRRGSLRDRRESENIRSAMCCFPASESRNGHGRRLHQAQAQGTGIQVCFFGIFSLLLLVAVPAEQDCGIEIFQMGQQKLRMQTEIPTEFSGRAVTETKCREERFAAGIRCDFFLRNKNRNQPA